MSNLTGIVLSPGGTPVTGTLYLQLSQDANLLATGGCGGPAAVASSPPFIFNLQNGVIVGPGMGPFQVPGADCLTPSNLTYHMTVTGSAGGTVLEKDVIITGPSVDLGTLTPVAPLGPVTPGGQLSGDVIGPASFNTVVRLQSRYVAATAPADLQTLVWNQAAGWWEPRLLALTGGGAAGQVAFWSAGQILAGDNNLFWNNSTKRLGVGTATPANPLTVKGASGLSQFAITVNGTNYGELYIDNNSDFTIRSTGHNIFLQPGGGNVGIGTTVPQGTLELDSAAQTALVMSGGGDHLWRFLRNGAGDPSLYLYGSAAYRMAWLASGNVGIGTSSPADKLQIVGGSVILDNAMSYKILDAGATPRAMVQLDAGNIGHLGAQGGGAYDLALHAGSATAVAYLKGVNFGIGTTNPLSRLSVAGTIEITSGSGGVIKFADGTTQATAAAAGAVSSVSGSGGTTGLTLTGGPTGAVTLTLGGLLVVASGGTGVATVAPNLVFAGPTSGGSAPPAFRALVAGDIPGGGGGGSGTVTSISAATGITLTPNPIVATGTIGLTIPVVPSSGGTGTTTAFTAGSVIFAGASGVYSQDNAQLFWDDGNNRLGIGTTTPNALVDASDPNKAQYFAGMAARGKVNAFEWGFPNASGYGSTLGFTVGAGYSFVGFDCQAGTGTNTFKTGGVKASIIVGDNAGGMQLGSVASASADNQVLVPFVTVLNSGNVGIGTTTPGSLLTVNGTIEIASGSGGVLKFADGTTQASAAAAGGTVGGSGATGQVTYWSASNSVAGDSGHTWDSVNDRLIINANAVVPPAATAGTGIQVAGADAVVARIEVESFGAATAFTGRRANGTAGALTAVTTDDVLAQLNASGYTNAAAYSSVSADVQLKAAEPFTAANQGAYIIFRTTLKTTATLSEKMRLTDAGNLGIGTTAPQGLLHVGGATSYAAIGQSGQYSIINLMGVPPAISSTGWNIGCGSTDQSLYLNSPASLQFRIANVTKMTLDANGWLGIGTTGPQAALEVSGTTKVALDAGNGALWIANPTAPTNYTTANYDRLGIFYTGNVATIQTSAAGTGTLRPLRIQTGSNNGIYIDATGKVGIGIVPVTFFHVSGPSGEIRIDDTSVTGAQWRILASDGAAKNFRIYDQNLGAERLRIDGSGYVIANVAFVGPAATVPQNSQAGAYTLVLADRGKHILAGAGVTVPASVFAAGDIVTIYNNTAGNITVTQGASVTMYLAGTATTGNRTLAQRGVATVLCVASNTFVISGGGLT